MKPLQIGDRVRKFNEKGYCDGKLLKIENENLLWIEPHAGGIIFYAHIKQCRRLRDEELNERVFYTFKRHGYNLEARLVNITKIEGGQ